jgi:hypothetical protein
LLNCLVVTLGFNKIMTQEQLSEGLAGKSVLKIYFTDKDESNLKIESISFTDGELLTFGDQVALTHPEKDAELKAFYEVLSNVPPSGLITFKAKFLPQGLIDREMSAKHKELKSNGYGPARETRQDYLTYRFDMPENQ